MLNYKVLQLFFFMVVSSVTKSRLHGRDEVMTTSKLFFLHLVIELSGLLIQLFPIRRKNEDALFSYLSLLAQSLWRPPKLPSLTRGTLITLLPPGREVLELGSMQRSHWLKSVAKVPYSTMWPLRQVHISTDKIDASSFGDASGEAFLRICGSLAYA